MSEVAGAAAPFAWSLAIGQAQIAVTYFVTLGTPLGVALAAHIKLLPALVAVYWLGREDWRGGHHFPRYEATMSPTMESTSPDVAGGSRTWSERRRSNAFPMAVIAS